MKPVILRGKSSTPVVIVGRRVFVLSRQQVGYFRIKLTTKSLIGEKIVFIKGVRAATIVRNIKKKMEPENRYTEVSGILYDNNNRIIRSKSLIVKNGPYLSEKDLTNFVNDPEIQPFLRMNQKVHDQS
ncbi:hypothetical protein [Flavobacterium sp.]|jgi:hypothetical protein|uniref:hypothetical protein n=1 Tax=Flavobacterium sp. TaxID=239 RepID=UPI0037BFF912